MRTTITTKGISPASRSTHWHQAIAGTYFPLDLRFRHPERFNGDVTGWSLGNVSLSRLRSEALMYRRLPRHLAREREEELLITVPARAEVHFSQCGREVRCGPGGYILERSHEPYEFRHDERAELWVMKLPTASLEGRISSPDRFCGMQFNATDGAGGLFVDMLHHVPERYDAMSDAVRAVVGRQLVDLLALSLDSDERTLTGGASSVRTAHLTRVERFVRANLHRMDLDPERIATQCGISVRYLHELFRDTNRTLGQWVRDMRLDAAREDLRSADGRYSIAEICYRRGFNDQAQFSRSFRQRFNCTPSEFRRKFLSRTGDNR
jgi:AraC-like DNA-binding protein